MDRKGLNILQVAVMYIGVIMGAGFASGRETWQFFGVFGKAGIGGVILATAGFVIFGHMISYIAISKNTQELGELVNPFNSPVLDSIIGWVIAIMYYSMIIAMSAAGGSLLEYQFGINKIIGGTIVVVLTVITAAGDFQRVSGVFRRVIPVTFAVVIFSIIAVILKGQDQSGPVSGYDPGVITPNPVVAAFVFLSYDCLGMITMAAATAIRAKDRKTAFSGSLLGTLLLGGLTMLLLMAILTDMKLASSLDLPMLGYAMKISPVLNYVYAVVLYIAVYSTASSTFYGFSTKLKPGKTKLPVMIGGAAVGLLAGLTGFKKIVEVLYPMQGYIGFAVFALIIANYIKEVRKNHVSGTKPETQGKQTP